MKEIIKFLKYGSLLDIKIGSSLEHVVELLGKADDKIINGSLVLYKFGSLEVTFQENQTTIINVEVFDNEFSILDINYKISESVEEVTEILDENDIGWHICSEKSYDSTLAIVCESECILYFELPRVGVSKIQVSSLNEKYYKYK